MSTICDAVKNTEGKNKTKNDKDLHYNDDANDKLSDNDPMSDDSKDVQGGKNLNKEISQSSGYQTQDSFASLSSASFEGSFQNVSGSITPEDSIQDSICFSPFESTETIKQLSGNEISVPMELSLQESDEIQDHIQIKHLYGRDAFNLLAPGDIELMNKANDMISSGSHSSEVEKFLVSNKFMMSTEEGQETQRHLDELPYVLAGLGKLHFICNDYDAWTPDEKELLIEMIKKSNGCKKSHCEDILCPSVKALLKIIKSKAKSGTLLLYPPLIHIVWCIIEHSDDCDNLRCDVSWCTFFYDLSDEREEKVARLLKLYRQVGLGFENFDELSQERLETQYSYIMDNTVRWPSVTNPNGVPVQGTDYYILNRLGKFGETNLLGVSTTLPPLYMQISQYKGFEGCKEFWEGCYKTDRNNKPSSIVHHLWVYGFGKMVNECLIYSDEKNLNKFIKKMGPVNCTRRLQSYTSGLLSAVSFMSMHGALYLSWRASGIQIDESRCIARLGDFSYATTIGSLQEDDELIVMYIMSLPPQLIPPEMFSLDVGEYTDIWGVGCTLYHLTTGNILHHQHQHDEDGVLSKVESLTAESVFVKIQSEVENEWARNLLASIFTGVDNRKSAEELLQLLPSAGLVDD